MGGSHQKCVEKSVFFIFSKKIAEKSVPKRILLLKKDYIRNAKTCSDIIVSISNYYLIFFIFRLPCFYRECVNLNRKRRNCISMKIRLRIKLKSVAVIKQLFTFVKDILTI